MARSLVGVASQMLACGMPDINPAEIRVNTVRPVRYGPKKRAWYRIFELTGRTGRAFFVGAFGCWGRIDTQKIEPDDEEVDPADLARVREQAREAAEREAALRSRLAQRAADNAHRTWRESLIMGDSAYLKRKRIDSALLAGWVRYLADGTIVVPMARYDQERELRLKGVQLIHPDGVKRFTRDMEKIGTACVLGAHIAGKPIVFCEGLATAASVWLAIERRFRVVVAFDAGNLQWAAHVFRELDPAAPFLFCADDDFATEGNPGRMKACIAARLYDGQVLFPLFRDRGARKLTDFNDLHVTEGLGEVRDQVGRWLPKA